VTPRSVLARLQDRDARMRAAIAFMVAVATGIAAFVLSPMLFLALLAAGTAVFAWLLLPEAVIALLLLARSSVDAVMELFTLFAGSPLSMNLSGAANSLAVGLGAVALIRRLLDRQSLFVSAPGTAFAFFMLVSLLSIPNSVDPVSGVKEWARLSSGLAIYVMVTSVVRDERRARRFILICLCRRWFRSHWPGCSA